MAQSKHKYRVSVYLGKELYTKFEAMAKVFGISVASLTKLMLDNGVAFAEQMERQAKAYGNK